jgi:hypothetical protein
MSMVLGMRHLLTLAKLVIAMSVPPDAGLAHPGQPARAVGTSTEPRRGLRRERRVSPVRLRARQNGRESRSPVGASARLAGS